MQEKHELTEVLKVLETEIYDIKIDIRNVNAKLENAYKYEDELIQRMNFAKSKTLELRNQSYKKCSEISEKYEKMKKIFDVFTGNFYKH